MSEYEFFPGQRWISNTELQMGLGTVLTVDHRSVQIVFLSTGDTRTYAKRSAPLNRVRFDAGDNVRTHDGGTLLVEQVEECEGLLYYAGRDQNGEYQRIGEGQLDNFMQLSRPSERLLGSQIDKAKWFVLRQQTREFQYQLSRSRLFGLLGGRTSLLPHQLYIANEVAGRYAPRVLLADEVGLGKTIEAGLIVHQQLLTERAQRVLIVVPESLVHQWLVEMLRRFNLFFSLFDEQRCNAIQEDDESVNPFQSEQWVICSLGFLTDSAKYYQHCLHGDWDMVIVDEAHHLAWSPGNVSREYQCIEQLVKAAKGVLLLTATPEQLGKVGHFARLRLLDPDRFPDYDRFIEEENHYAPLAEAIDNLLSDSPLSPTNYHTLLDMLSLRDKHELLDRIQGEQADPQAKTQAQAELIQHLLDRHGTGRVLFRNTRAAVKGFPERQLNSYALPLPAEYAACLQQLQDAAITEPQLLLSPELLYMSVKQDNQAAWEQIDPRLDWLADHLKSVKPDKVLVIVASADSALDIAQVLQSKHGMHAAVFHEGLSIVERDRAAAFFADDQEGAQVLVCSEIGSEGRNFQFARHLVLFDLPLNPDLLEQRIGRLDRIGQRHTVRLHVPYLENSAQKIMKCWYHEGLNAFEHTCTAGQSVFNQLETSLLEALHQIDAGLEDLNGLIETTKTIHQQLTHALQQGRDRLLELSSFDEQQASELVDEAFRQTRADQLNRFLNTVFDQFGVEVDVHSHKSFVISPGDHARINLPGVNEDGLLITYDRETALANEDMHFISWEHPLTTAAIDHVLTNETGNTAMVTIEKSAIAAGTLLIECLYVMETNANAAIQTGRYLPTHHIRIVIDQTGKQYGNVLDHEYINQCQKHVKFETAIQVVRSHGSLLRQMITASDKLAAQAAPAIVAQAKQLADQLIGQETQRLKDLKEHNPNVRDAEIDYFQQLNRDTHERLDTTVAQLDAIRVMIAT